MRKILTIAVLLFVSAISLSVSASDTKVNGRLYASWYMNTSDDANSENAFSVNRAYVTVKSKISDYSSVRITTDIRNVDNFDGYSIILKYGYFDWKPQFANGNLKVRFGLQPTLYIDNMNKLWNRRYLEKTVGDKNKFLTTSDLGLSAMVNLDKKGKTGYIGLQVLNGTKYSNVEELNSNKDIGAFALLKPLSNNDNFKRSRILGQAYFGTHNKVIDTTLVGTEADAAAYKNQIFSVGGMLGYGNILDLGFDVNSKTNGQGYDAFGTEIGEVTSSGISFFGTLYFGGLSESDSFARTLNLFGRIDILDPDTDTDDDGNSLFIAGIECNPTKGFKASFNYRMTSYQDDSDSKSSLNLNTLFKF